MAYANGEVMHIGKILKYKLDAPEWRKEGDDEPYDAIESYFALLHS